MPQQYKGKVVYGSKRAAVLGYPTVNIEFKDSDVSGIFAARVTIEGTTRFAAAFADPKRGVLEAHILDVSADFYGKEAEIELVHKIRDTEAFTDDDTLKAAMASDVAAVRAYFTHV